MATNQLSPASCSYISEILGPPKPFQTKLKWGKQNSTSAKLLKKQNSDVITKRTIYPQLLDQKLMKTRKTLISILCLGKSVGCRNCSVLLSTLGFPGSSAGKESACNAGNSSSIPGSGRSPGEGNCYPLQYSGLENFMDCIVHEVPKSWTCLSDFHFTLLSTLVALTSLELNIKF